MMITRVIPGNRALIALTGSVSDRDSQFIIAQSEQIKRGESEYDAISKAVPTGCSTRGGSAWSMCQASLSHPNTLGTVVLASMYNLEYRN